MLIKIPVMTVVSGFPACLISCCKLSILRGTLNSLRSFQKPLSVLRKELRRL
nr:hypothetical protein [uncultured bacterium]